MFMSSNVNLEVFILCTQRHGYLLFLCISLGLDIELRNQPTAYVVSERVNMTYHLNNDEINIDRHDDDTDTPHQNPPKPAA